MAKRKSSPKTKKPSKKKATKKKATKKKATKKKATKKKATKKKATKKKATKKKATKKKATKKKATKKKATKKKATKKKPAAKKPAKKKTTAKKPAAKQSAAKEPAAKKPAAKSGGGAQARIGVGDPAPAFDLPSDDGKRYSLADLAGKRVVLYFYPKDNTPGCTAEACEFSAQSAFADRGVVVLGVSADSVASHANFRNKFNLTIPLLSDPDHEVATRYGAWGEKTLYGRTFLGMIRSTFVIGPDAKIERVYFPVRKAAGHAAEVLASLPA